MKYICRCCGYRTLEEEPNGSYEICPVCFWEDDEVQSNDENLRGGANIPSLKEARENFKKFGACEQRCISYVRPPLKDELV